MCTGISNIISRTLFFWSER